MKATHAMALSSSPSNLRISFPPSTLHKMAACSLAAVRTKRPSGENAMAETAKACRAGARGGPCGSRAGGGGCGAAEHNAASHKTANARVAENAVRWTHRRNKKDGNRSGTDLELIAPLYGGRVSATGSPQGTGRDDSKTPGVVSM